MQRFDHETQRTDRRYRAHRHGNPHIGCNVQYSQYANKRIITIEDPIEFILTTKMRHLTERTRFDTDSFALALKHALRHDPDVIIVGEMRDLETMATAVAAAETGH